MERDRRYDWAAACAAQLLNLGHIDDGTSKSDQFTRIVRVIYDAIRLADQEARNELLKPSDN